MANSEASTFAGVESIHAFVETRREPEWVRTIRRTAEKRFLDMGWPTPNDEEWRRTDISMYDFGAYRYEGEIGAVPPGIDVPEGYAGVIRFDGVHAVGAGLDPAFAEKGVIFTSLSHLLAEEGHNHAQERRTFFDHLERMMSHSAETGDNRMYAWHYALWNYGAVVYVPRNVAVDKPLLVELHQRNGDVARFPHVSVVLEEGADAKVIEWIRGDEEGEVVVNEGFDGYVGPGAHLGYYSVHDLNIDSTVFSNGTIRVDRDATLHHFVTVFGGLLSKMRFDANLVGSGADVVLDGLYFGHEDQHMDLRTVQNHKAPHANSRTFYKGAVKDEARSVYQGLIAVDHGAVQTDAYLTNNNLILNDGARADSIPSLQINTDDVKCSHGSTTGKIDADQLFYLQTRGFSDNEAKSMLVQGFYDELIVRAPEVIQDALREKVIERIRESV
ncbi:MAG: Fe-S cluster assembly protein SufD [Spirochaetaceae bacterium]